MISVENLKSARFHKDLANEEKGEWRNIPANMSDKVGGVLKKLGKIGDNFSFHCLVVLVHFLRTDFRV